VAKAALQAIAAEDVDEDGRKPLRSRVARGTLGLHEVGPLRPVAVIRRYSRQQESNVNGTLCCRAWTAPGSGPQSSYSKRRNLLGGDD
jgi:hypothetical protein